MWYLYLKAFHIIGFISWFAAMFYLPRLLIYHVEANDKKPLARLALQEQFEIMQERLFKIIMTPAMVATMIGGWGMVFMNPVLLTFPWLLSKLFLIGLLLGYHYACWVIIKRLKEGSNSLSSYQLRLFNEIPTLLMVAIVLLAVLKNMLNFGYAFIGLILFGVALVWATKFYRKIRTGK